jgi:hypothetical protein
MQHEYIFVPPPNVLYRYMPVRSYSPWWRSSSPTVSARRDGGVVSARVVYTLRWVWPPRECDFNIDGYGIMPL